MRQRTTVLFVVAVAALAVLASAATATATGLNDVGSDVSAPAPAATDGAASDSVSPGQRLSGVIGAQRAEVAGEIETRSFGIRVATASSSRAKAGVVAAEVNDLESRLETLQSRRAELERAHENGSVSRGRYQAQVTELVARIQTTQRRVNATDDVANELPESDLEAAGVEQSNIAQLRQRATNLTGKETADLARSIVGDDVGQGMGAPPEVSGPVARGNAGANDPNATETGAPGRGNGSHGANGSVGVNGSANGSVGVNGSANGSVGEDGVNLTANGSVGDGGAGAGVDLSGETETDAPSQTNETTTAGETTSDATTSEETSTDVPTSEETSTDEGVLGGLLSGEGSTDTTTADTTTTAASESETETAA